MAGKKSLDVYVHGSREGSNPGSMCSIPSRPDIGDCYIKYCPGSKGDIGDLTATNQPIYEALTNSFSKKLGLSVPSTFVLIDYQKDVNFIDSGREGIGKDRRYYFVSKIVPETKRSSNEERKKKWQNIFEQEEFYLDLLGIKDVKNRKDNFILSEKEDGDEVIYFDLGCSLGVWAKQSDVGVKEKYLKELGDKKSIKRKRKTIDRWNVVPKGNTDKINLGDMIHYLPYVEVPVINPAGKKNICDLVNEEEIEMLQNLSVIVMEEAVRKNKGNPSLIKSK